VHGPLNVPTRCTRRGCTLAASAPTKNLLFIRVTIDNDWHFLGLPSARPHPARKDVGMLLEHHYVYADPPKCLPPIPVRVSRRSQLTAALRQHARRRHRGPRLSMTVYPIELHRRLEQKWVHRIDQILTVAGIATPPRDPNDGGRRRRGRRPARRTGGRARTGRKLAARA
jgi:hypothetical protein